MLKSQRLKFSRMIVTRTWTKCNSDNTHVQATSFLDVWDSGSRRYERFSDGKEVCWEVLSRELNETGFSETLSHLPHWETVGDIAWSEKIALLKSSDSVLEVPGWKVTIEVLQPQAEDQGQSPSQERRRPPPHSQRGRGHNKSNARNIPTQSSQVRTPSNNSRGRPSRGRQGASSSRPPQPPGTQGPPSQTL
jgi:hypothetical protein